MQVKGRKCKIAQWLCGVVVDAGERDVMQDRAMAVDVFVDAGEREVMQDCAMAVWCNCECR
jgi:hypothetical protein